MCFLNVLCDLHALLACVVRVREWEFRLIVRGRAYARPFFGMFLEMLESVVCFCYNYCIGKDVVPMQ